MGDEIKLLPFLATMFQNKGLNMMDATLVRNAGSIKFMFAIAISFLVQRLYCGQYRQACSQTRLTKFNRWKKSIKPV
jgi:hypothetical protein